MQQFMLPVIRKSLNDLMNVTLHDSTGIWEKSVADLSGGRQTISVYDIF